MYYTVPTMFDAHVHLREGRNLPEYVAETARCCDHAVVMPNLEKPITTVEQLRAYRNSILDAHENGPMSDHPFTPLMMVYLTEDTTPTDVAELAEAGATGYKIYPKGATTQSGHGVPVDMLRKPPQWLLHAVKAMECEDLVLCVHGEFPDEHLFKREPAFVQSGFFDAIFREAPNLRVVLEHISTQDGLACVRHYRSRGCRMAGTITLHHLLLDIGDVVGRVLNFCRPCPMMPADKVRLRDVAVTAAPGFFLGSDSAPHVAKAKLTTECCAGCYTSPVLLEGLFDIFWQTYRNHSGVGADDLMLESFENFTSHHGREFYGLPKPAGRIALCDTAKKIPANSQYGTGSIENRAIPFGYGERLNWQWTEWQLNAHRELGEAVTES
jgi:dihydroorotase